MHIIIVGAGEVGMHVAETLAAAEHDVVLIERDREKAEAASSRLDALVLQGNGASPTLLRTAGIQKAGLLVAVTNSDESNLIACLSARSMGYARLQTIARVRDDSYYEEGSAVTHGALGISLVVHPDRTTAEDLAEALLLPGAVNVERFADGRLVMAEVILTARSPVIDEDFQTIRATGEHMIAGVMREGVLGIAYDESRAQVGDHIFVIAGADQVGEVVRYLAGESEQVRHAVLYGASPIGRYLAALLAEQEIGVRLIERDMKLAQETAQDLDGVLVLHGDATDRDLLIEEGVRDSHAFVACSSDDASNLLSSLTAKQVGAHLTLTVVSRVEYLALTDTMRIDAAVSPRIRTADAIVRFVRRGRVLRLHHLVGGAEMLELAPDVTAPIVGRPLRDVGVPRDCVISAIVRDDEVIYPRGGNVILEGDRVLVLALPTAIRTVERLFER